MKAIYLTIAALITAGILLGNAAVQFAAVGAALGWIYYEDKKAKEVRK